MNAGAKDLGQSTRWTYADWLNLPSDGYRYEIIDGALVKEPPASTEHGAIITELLFRIGQLLSPPERRLLFGATVGVKLSEHRVVIPDLVYVRPERQSIIGHDVINGVPDLVAEVLSPSNRHFDLGKKLSLYAEHGIPEYWIIDPADRSVTVLTDPVDDNYLTGVKHASPAQFYSPRLDREFETFGLFAAY